MKAKDVTESLKNAMPGLPSQAIAAAKDETVMVVREHANEFKQKLYPV